MNKVAVTSLIALAGVFFSNNSLAAKPKNWSITLDAGGYYDSNVGKAKWLRDRVEDEVAYLDANWQYTFKPSMGSLVSVNILAEAEQFDTLDTLNNYSYGAALAYSWQNRFGYLAPFYRSSLTFKQHESDSVGRSSENLEFQFFATRRITTAITGRLGYQYDLSKAEHEVFDNEQHRVFANFDYTWSQNLLSYFTASYMQGDIYSVAQGTFCNGLAADDIYPLIKYSDVIWRDRSFNQHFCGDWFAYRMSADTTTYNLGFNYALSHKYSLDLSATYVDSQVADSVDYQREIIRAGILMKF